MPVITVGQLHAEQMKLNKNGEERWVRGIVRLYPGCGSLLSEIGQRKLPFTFVTGRIIPKEPVILLGEITSYRIPDKGIDWKTLEIQKILSRNDVVFEELGVSFDEAARKIARKDKEFLKKIGSIELTIRKKITDLLGKKNRFADKMLELFGDRAYKELSENPWKMIQLVPYFTIAHADKVAERLGIPMDDGRRFKEYFRYLLDRSFESNRNTYLSKNEFLSFYWMNFSEEFSQDEFEHLACEDGSPVIRSSLGYHPAHFYFAERASFNIIQKSLDVEIPITEREQYVTEQVLKDSDIVPTAEQEGAIWNALHSPLHIITGGPGTGKTTVLRVILTKLMMLTGSSPMAEHAPFLLVAPTGKAAYRMWEQTGISAHTIHSAFSIIPEYGCLNVEETAKRLSHVRYLIIDESSMLDTKLFGDMCRVMLKMDHIPFLLLVGDIDQLPPVQHGQVFKDLVEFLRKHAPSRVTELTVLKRQADGSSIPELAAHLKEGRFPDLSWFEDKEDVFFVPSGMEGFQNLLVKGVLEPKADILDTIQILTPYRNGDQPDTIYAVNQLVEPLYNPPQPGEDILLSGVACGNPPRRFRVGDKVINRTNRSKEVINGSIGRIIRINDAPRDIFAWTMTVDFDGHETTYVYEEFKDLELAYAITIHASQGSEYENVVLEMLRGGANPEFLNRNLLYVAVTRASKKLVLMGQISTFQQVARTKAVPRKTALAVWLKQIKI